MWGKLEKPLTNPFSIFPHLAGFNLSATQGFVMAIGNICISSLNGHSINIEKQ